MSTNSVPHSHSASRTLVPICDLTSSLLLAWALRRSSYEHEKSFKDMPFNTSGPAARLNTTSDEDDDSADLPS